MFRYKKSIPVSYERQGYIYFSSLLYRELPEVAQAARVAATAVVPSPASTARRER